MDSRYYDIIFLMMWGLPITEPNLKKNIITSVA